MNVLEFGAANDATSDDAPAIQRAIDSALASGSICPEIVFPSGRGYLLRSPITIPRPVVMRGAGIANIIIGHDGAGFVMSGIPAPNTFPRGKTILRNLRFTTDGSVPECAIQNGVTGASPTYLGSQNDTVISDCSFDQFSATHAVVNYRGFNLTFERCQFLDLTVTSAVEMKQSPSDTPTWSFAVNFFGCDFTNIRGGGIAMRADSGDLFVYGGVIEGCAGDAVVLAESAAYLGYPVASFHGVYWEANTGRHVVVKNRAGSVGFFGNKFTSGGRGNSFAFKAGTKANFYNCTTPNNACSFDGGNVVLQGCNYMVGSKTVSTNLMVDGNVYQSTTGAALSLDNQVRANQPGGGAILALVSFYDGPQAPAVSETFMVSIGAAGGRLEAVSLGRATGGGSDVTFAFSSTPDGSIQVAPSIPGNIKCAILGSLDGAFMPA